MSCEHLICAQCAGPVAEGRCPVCRSSRDHVHQSSHGPSLPLLLAAALVLVLLGLAALHLGH
jgi:uncharacterized paraquat-inducible protein A